MTKLYYIYTSPNGTTEKINSLALAKSKVERGGGHYTVACEPVEEEHYLFEPLLKYRARAVAR